MALERTSDNFDINAILSAVDRGNGDAPSQARYGTLLDDMDRAEAERLGLDNPAQVAIIRDINEMIEVLQANRSSGEGNELAGLITRIAGRLPVGVSTAAANAIMMEVERRDRNEGGVFSNAEWDRIKDEVKKERAEQAKIADFADDAQNATQRMTPEQWDQAPSREYPGMTNAEALSAIRRINGNLPFYSQMAVQRGLIREDERPEFERLMQVRERMLVAERNGNTNTSEYQADRRTWETAPQNLRTATTDIVVFANERGADGPSPVVTAASGNGVGSAALDTRTDAFTVEAGAPPSAPPVPVSVAANLDRADGATADRISLASTFNSSASGASAPQPPAAVVAPTAPAPPRVAAAGFDQSTGMI